MTPTKDSNIAWVEYAPSGRYSVVSYENGKEQSRHTLPIDKEIHGMAWDNLTEALYLIITDNDGMHIAKLEHDKLCPVTRSAYTTLSDLRAKDGKLYFGSIASSRDELHYLDLATGKEYQLSESSFGSFSPAPYDSNHIVATSYDRRGHLPVTQRVTTTREVEYRPHP